MKYGDWDMGPADVNTAALEYEAWAKGKPVPPLAALAGAGFSRWAMALNGFTERSNFTRRYSFAIPCAEAIEALKLLGPIVEVGAGSGIWAAILEANGIDIIATEAERKSHSGYGQQVCEFFPGRRLKGAEAVRGWPDRAVLAVWPCHSRPWGFEAGVAMKVGQRLALVHEGSDGCIGTPELFQLLDEKFESERVIPIPQWPGIHDQLEIFRKVRR